MHILFDNPSLKQFHVCLWGTVIDPESSPNKLLKSQKGLPIEGSNQQ